MGHASAGKVVDVPVALRPHGGQGVDAGRGLGLYLRGVDDLAVEVGVFQSAVDEGHHIEAVRVPLGVEVCGVVLVVVAQIIDGIAV